MFNQIRDRKGEEIGFVSMVSVFALETQQGCAVYTG